MSRMYNQSVIVLGAGIIGVCVAIHLQRRGWSVSLVDRKGPGNETSYGNAGLIERDGVVPYGFPREIKRIIASAMNMRLDVHYHLRAMPGMASFLWKYWRNSRPDRHLSISKSYAPLIERSITEHAELISAAAAAHIVQRDGWIQLFRSDSAQSQTLAGAERIRREFDVGYEVLSRRDIAEREPNIKHDFVGGVRWTQAWSVQDPLDLTNAYTAYFRDLGGLILNGDATSIRQQGRGWTVLTSAGRIEGEQALIALGPWADLVTRKLGYKIPLAVKRGYHMHYRPLDGAILNHAIADGERGYLLAPMRRGVRLITGVEFAHRDAAPTPVQIDRAEKVARSIFPMGERIDAAPWMGCRPCTPDMMPIIGRAPKHSSLWFAFGHSHHGLTLGAVTGRALAELMTGEEPCVELSPFTPARFAQ